MTDVDDLPVRLRAQMRAATAADVAPADLVERVQRAGARRRNRQAVGGAALVGAAVLGGLALPPAASTSAPDRLATVPPPGVELTLLRNDDGRLSLSTESRSDRPEERIERVELPGYLRNDSSGSVTVLALAVPGTDLKAPSAPVVLVPDGRLPLSLLRVVDCDASPSLPDRFNLQARVRGPQGESTVLLPLPEEVVTQYRANHACSPARRAADDAEARARAEAQRQATEAGTD